MEKNPRGNRKTPKENKKPLKGNPKKYSKKLPKGNVEYKTASADAKKITEEIRKQLPRLKNVALYGLQQIKLSAENLLQDEEKKNPYKSVHALVTSNASKFSDVWKQIRAYLFYVSLVDKNILFIMTCTGIANFMELLLLAFVALSFGIKNLKQTDEWNPLQPPKNSYQLYELAITGTDGTKYITPCFFSTSFDSYYEKILGFIKNENYICLLTFLIDSIMSVAKGKVKHIGAPIDNIIDQLKSYCTRHKNLHDVWDLFRSTKVSVYLFAIYGDQNSKMSKIMSKIPIIERFLSNNSYITWEELKRLIAELSEHLLIK